MISLAYLLPICLALPSASASPEPLYSPAEPLFASSAAVQQLDIKGEIDRALRWLRSQQDLQSGAYGGLHTSLLALKAMATSPRAYRPSDGPYMARALAYVISAQASDGAFAALEAAPAERVADTQTAVFLLELFATPGDATKRALAFLGEHGRGQADGFAARWQAISESDERRAGLEQRARKLLDERVGDGHWQNEQGALLASVQSLLELNSLQRQLKSIKSVTQADASITALPDYVASLEPAALAKAKLAMLRGAEFLVADAITAGRWGFQGHADPGITAMAATALLGLPAPRPAPIQASIDSAITWLISLQHEDGSIHAGQLANYVTSASIMALVRADAEAHAVVIERARNFLVRLQADEGEGYSPTDRFYGGVGYGGDERPDLSNMNMALEALSDAGLPQGDETFRKALSFLQRCQNRSESNDLVLTIDGETLVSGNDGGSGYAPGDSKAGYITLRDGRKVPRSYGSMTYALLKGYLFAGLAKNDGRVEAAWKWLSANYTLDVNPGFEASSDPTAGYQGLFYYYTSMSKALALYNQQMVTDAMGRQHDWRAELVGRVVSLQRQDGSWVNANAPRWYEGNPVLASAYALVTLANALPGK